jgi:hypothetical protein
MTASRQIVLPIQARSGGRSRRPPGRPGMDAGRDGNARKRRRPKRRTNRQASRAVYLALLLATVAVAALPAVLLQPDSRISVLKLAVVVLLGSMPGLLYVQFVRFKGPSLYNEYVLNLFRLRIDQYCNLPAPPKHTTYYRQWQQDHKKLDKPGPDNLYRRKFEAIFGEHAVSTRELFANGARPAHSEGFYPVLLATALLCIGWVLVVQPELYRSIDLLGGLPFSGKPNDVPYEALKFGFLGAYWFIVQDLVRRYFRQDLKTAAYLSVSTRIIVVTIVVAAVSLLNIGTVQQQSAAAFLIGVFPQVGLQLLKAATSKVLGRSIPTLAPKYPLDQLDGMTLWDQARLLEEGIDDLHALATANLVDLMLGTRVPVNRLVDWLDQALLLLHLPLDRDGQPSARERLRVLGIRTATDLIRVCESTQPRSTRIRHHIGAVLDVDAAAVDAILSSLTGHPNLVHVQAFTSHDWLNGADESSASDQDHGKGGS